MFLHWKWRDTKEVFNRLLCIVLTALLLVSIPSGGDIALAAASGETNTKVVLRKARNTNSKALQTLYEGEEVDILKTYDDWYKVRYGKYTGYLKKEFVNTASSPTSVASATERIRALGTAPGIMRVGDSNSDVRKLQQALSILGYYHDEVDGKYGSDTTEAVKAYQKAQGLIADGYAGERTVKRIFGSCNAKSLTTQRAPGSVTSAVTVPTATATPSKYPTVDSISAITSPPTSTLREGSSGTAVVKLQQALECLGYYHGAIDGDFGSGTTSAVKVFQNKRGMKADGVAGPSTLRVLFGTSAASPSKPTAVKLKTEVLDWYKDNVSSVIPKGARFTVKDVLTGKTFEMVRWSGGDHMDAEPRSAQDTAAIKAIYGGSFSWRRRAILVKYNGHVYAASMNGMPHGTDTLSNDFDGHLCIHFKNSKTHGSDRIDPDHQAAVTKASKATW